jgi:integrase
MGGKPFEKRVNKRTGSILVRVTVGYQGKKQIRVSKTFPKGTSETTMLLWALQAKEQGLLEQDTPQRWVSHSFDALLDEWLDYKQTQVAVKTFRIYKLSCNAYLRGRFGNVAEVTPDDVQRVIDQHAHLSPRSLELIKTYARMVFSYGVERGYLTQSPVTKDIIVPKRRRKRAIRVLTVEQFDRLSRLLDTPSERDLALRTLLLSGLRVSELMALQPHHVSENTLTVEQSIESRYGERIPTPPKSDHAYRTITIPASLAASLRQQGRGRLLS